MFSEFDFEKLIEKISSYGLRVNELKSVNLEEQLKEYQVGKLATT